MSHNRPVPRHKRSGAPPFQIEHVRRVVLGRQRQCFCEPPKLCRRHFKQLDAQGRYDYRKAFGPPLTGGES